MPVRLAGAEVIRNVGRRLVGISADVAAAWTTRAMARWPSAIPEDRMRLLFDRAGFHLLRKHYYAPIPDEADVAGDYFQRESSLPGLDMNERLGLSLLATVFPRYAQEFRDAVPLERAPGDGGAGIALLNGTFMAVDAPVYYALIRHGKPARIVEIGGGNSTRFAAMACERNRQETGLAPRLTVAEPYPSERLRQGFPGLTELLEAKVQEAGLDLFTSLGAGDILFIDSSHVLRAGGDVQYEYLEILPRLAPGVLVHVHDVSLPKPYPRVYFESGLYWNEQDLLQAFLAFNGRFEVLWAGNYMLLRHPDEVLAVFPEIDAMRRRYPQSEPTSFWMRVRP